MHETGLGAEFGIFVLVQNMSRERCSILAFDQTTDLYGARGVGTTVLNYCPPARGPRYLHRPCLACLAGQGWHRLSRERCADKKHSYSIPSHCFSFSNRIGLLQRASSRLELITACLQTVRSIPYADISRDQANADALLMLIPLTPLPLMETPVYIVVLIPFPLHVCDVCGCGYWNTSA